LQAHRDDAASGAAGVTSRFSSTELLHPYVTDMTLSNTVQPSMPAWPLPPDYRDLSTYTYRGKRAFDPLKLIRLPALSSRGFA
jgi:hypothetical protein